MYNLISLSKPKRLFNRILNFSSINIPNVHFVPLRNVAVKTIKKLKNKIIMLLPWFCRNKLNWNNLQQAAPTVLKLAVLKNFKIFNFSCIFNFIPSVIYRLNMLIAICHDLFSTLRRAKPSIRCYAVLLFILYIYFVYYFVP